MLHQRPARFAYLHLFKRLSWVMINVVILVSGVAGLRLPCKFIIDNTSFFRTGLLLQWIKADVFTSQEQTCYSTDFSNAMLNIMHQFRPVIRLSVIRIPINVRILFGRGLILPSDLCLDLPCCVIIICLVKG